MSCDAFLSYSHVDVVWVEGLAHRLADECGFDLWFDKWCCVPGKSFQQAMAEGLQEAASCAVFCGAETPNGWFNQEIESALNIQARRPDFRVIPVILPDGDPVVISPFLSLRTWVDFRVGKDTDYAFHVLKQGIKGEPIGRYDQIATEKYLQQMKELHQFRQYADADVIKDFQREILGQWRVSWRPK